MSVIPFSETVATRLAGGEHLMILVQPGERVDGKLTNIGMRRSRWAAEVLKGLIPDRLVPQVFYDPSDPVARCTAEVIVEGTDGHLMGTHSSLDSGGLPQNTTEWVQSPHRQSGTVNIGVSVTTKVLAGGKHENFGPGCLIYYFVSSGGRIVSTIYGYPGLEEERADRRREGYNSAESHVAVVFIRDLEAAVEMVANPKIHGRLRELSYQTVRIYAPGPAILEFMEAADQFHRLLEDTRIELDTRLTHADSMDTPIHLAWGIGWNLKLGQAAIVLGQWEWRWFGPKVKAVIYFIDQKTLRVCDHETIEV